jgi:hypothetical protein
MMEIAMMRKTQRYHLFAALFALLFLPTWVVAQGIESEPNNPCSEAQIFGAIGPPYDVSGTLDLKDVDFFRFESTAGTILAAHLEGSSTGQGTLYDPFLGLFDSACNLIYLNDNGGISLNARLIFEVPADNTFVLAASACCDYAFDGSHWDSGTYLLTLAEAPPPSSVSGRVVDAVTGEPLPGDSWPFAYAELFECWDSDCMMYDWINYQPTDSLGQFYFDSDHMGLPISAGTYRVEAWAWDYQSGSSEVFVLAEGEDLNIGDVALFPPPVTLSDIVACEYVPPIGGRCEYSVRVTNNQPGVLRGGAWSLVDVWGTGSYLGNTHFQAGRPERLILGEGDSTVVDFEFYVPGTVAHGAYICPDAWVGAGLRNPYYGTLIHRWPLFCIHKGIADTFTVIYGEEAETVVQHLSTQTNAKSLGPKRLAR